MAQLRPELRRAARHARADAGGGQGIQGLLRQGAGQDRRQLHGGPHGRLLRVRHAGPAASVRALRQRRRGAGADLKTLLGRSRRPEQRKTAPGRRPSWPRTQRAVRRLPASALRIFFIAATSIWRMRSALTPYSAASSCSVMPPLVSSLTFSQRSSTMRRLRASSTSSASAMPSPASQSRCRASSTRVGSCAVVGQVGDRARSSLRRRRSAARARRRRPTGAFPSRALLRA